MGIMKASNMRANNLTKILDKFVSIDGNLYRKNDEIAASYDTLKSIQVGQTFQLNRIEKYLSPINFNRDVSKQLGEAIVRDVHPFGFLFEILSNGKKVYVSKNDILTKEYELI